MQKGGPVSLFSGSARPATRLSAPGRGTYVLDKERDSRPRVLLVCLLVLVSRVRRGGWGLDIHRFGLGHGDVYHGRSKLRRDLDGRHFSVGGERPEAQTQIFKLNDRCVYAVPAPSASSSALRFFFCRAPSR